MQMHYKTSDTDFFGLMILVESQEVSFYIARAHQTRGSI